MTEIRSTPPRGVGEGPRARTGRAGRTSVGERPLLASAAIEHPSAARRGVPAPFLRSALRLAVRALALAATVAVTVLVVRAVDARGMPPLEPWHRLVPRGEVTAAGIARMDSLADYLERESVLFREVATTLADDPSPTARLATSRYNPDGPLHPSRFAIDGNRTREVAPHAPWQGPPRAGALLLHGLTDAPYSLHAVADRLAAGGVVSLAIRLPGHGTVPAALTTARGEDWLAAARLGLRHVRATIGPDKPLLVVGYSNGAALAMLLALESLEPADAGSADLPRPDAVLLLSPMVAVSPAARIGRLFGSLAIVPGLEQSGWYEILPEYLPFKYTSFPLQAARESAALTDALAARLARAESDHRLDALPPVLAFQSLADSTVSTLAVASHLFAHLPGAHHELVIFDLNRSSDFRPFLQQPGPERIKELRVATARGARLTVVTNASPATTAVVEQRDGHDRPLGLAWPSQVHSLSHVALPFPPDDPLYGREGPGLRLGALEPRGEKGVLVVPVEQLMRLTWNPFFPYLAERLDTWAASAPHTTR